MNKLKGMLFLFWGFALAGTSVISARVVMGRLGTFTITIASLFFALLCLIPLVGIPMMGNPGLGKTIFLIRQLKKTDWFFLSLQALFGIFLFRMFLLLGLQHTSSAEAGILIGATPAMTALFARFILKENITRSKWFGILSTVAGIIIVQGLLLPGHKFVLEHTIGNLLILCACFGESSFNICSRFLAVRVQSVQKASLPPMVQTMLVSAIALLFCILPASFETPFQNLSMIGVKEWLALIWYGVFVTAVAFICWYAGINRCNASTAAAFSGMMPFTALVLSALILKEPTGMQQWLGGVLIILGMIMIGISKE